MGGKKQKQKRQQQKSKSKSISRSRSRSQSKENYKSKNKIQQQDNNISDDNISSRSFSQYSSSSNSHKSNDQIKKRNQNSFSEEQIDYSSDQSDISQDSESGYSEYMELLQNGNKRKQQILEQIQQERMQQQKPKKLTKRQKKRLKETILENNKKKYKKPRKTFIQMTIDLNQIIKNDQIQDKQPYIKAVEYYHKMGEYKDDFRNIIQKCVIEQVTHNVWNQWIIRVLSKSQKVNHPIPLSNHVITDREETILHMNKKRIKNENQQEGIQDKCYDEIIEYVKNMENQYDSFKETQLNDLTQMKILSNAIKINPLYHAHKFNDDTTYLYDDQNYTININEENYNHLSNLYDDNNENNQNANEIKNFILFEAFFNYFFIAGRGYQWALPPQLMDLLKNEFNVKKELFASPMNHHFEQFHSLFDIDRYFGSSASSLVEQDYGSIGLEANPPFIETLMIKSSEIVEKNIISHQKQNKFQACFYVLPWDTSQAYINLTTNKDIFIDVLHFQPNQHMYFEIQKRVYEISPFSSYMIIVGTDQARELYTKEMKEKIISCFECKPILQKKIKQQQYDQEGLEEIEE